MNKDFALFQKEFIDGYDTCKELVDKYLQVQRRNCD